ncbi:hypothetical protein GIB67_032838 [Kingdonia uniflora]|uniref:Uncharacterized protein n=1 Tax=Kingdonia uniflora TaxID=39325 RepID=A0A7J7NC74_9MAGN|nr:hypothetical protein GIB67_032838 [Kingdonia uniflora]
MLNQFSPHGRPISNIFFPYIPLGFLNVIPPKYQNIDYSGVFRDCLFPVTPNQSVIVVVGYTEPDVTVVAHGGSLLIAAMVVVVVAIVAIVGTIVINGDGVVALVFAQFYCLDGPKRGFEDPNQTLIVGAPSKRINNGVSVGSIGAIIRDYLGEPFGAVAGFATTVSAPLLELSTVEESNRVADLVARINPDSEFLEIMPEDFPSELNQIMKEDAEGTYTQQWRVGALEFISLFANYLFHGDSTQHSQSDVNALIPVKAAAPQIEKGKGGKKRTPAKQRQSVQVPKDAEFLDETDDGGMHWTKADFTCLARAWVTASV